MQYQETVEYRELMAVFHRLWTAHVGTDGYDKRQWKDLDCALHNALRAAQGGRR